jgi:hypothetical protein
MTLIDKLKSLLTKETKHYTHGENTDSLVVTKSFCFGLKKTIIDKHEPKDFLSNTLNVYNSNNYNLTRITEQFLFFKKYYFIIHDKYLLDVFYHDYFYLEKLSDTCDVDQNIFLYKAKENYNRMESCAYKVYKKIEDHELVCDSYMWYVNNYKNRASDSEWFAYKYFKAAKVWNIKDKVATININVLKFFNK